MRTPAADRASAGVGSISVAVRAKLRFTVVAFAGKEAGQLL